MHDTAYEHGRLFFTLYGSRDLRTVVELGSQDVNGTLRDHSATGVHYIGLDVMPAKGVDLVVDPGAPLPLASDVVDAVVTSSAFEHDICFWDTFLELVRIVRPGGLLYVNAPSNGEFHRYPLDCWRFYPDAGVALVRWARRRGQQIALVESFIGQPKADQWADFVAVFRKAGGTPLIGTGRIADHVPAMNIHDEGVSDGAPLRAERNRMTNMSIAADLRVELAGHGAAALPADLIDARQRNDSLSEELEAARVEATGAYTLAEALRQELAIATQQLVATGQHLRSAQGRIVDLEHGLTNARQNLLAMQNSRSWRLTAGLRRMSGLLRGR